MIGTWSIVALAGAAAVLIQIPYSLDELIATLQFLRRRARAGQNRVRLLFVGDTDELPRSERHRQQTNAFLPCEFDRPASRVLRDTLSGGVNLPWNLALCAAIGLALILPHVTLGVDGNMAHVHHVVGALAMTVVSLAAADVAKAVH